MRTWFPPEVVRSRIDQLKSDIKHEEFCIKVNLKPHRKRAILEWVSALSAKGRAVSNSVLAYAHHVGLAKELAAMKLTPPPFSPPIETNGRPNGNWCTGNERDGELNLPDEDRILFEIRIGNYQCPNCCWLGTSPVLERVMVDRKPKYRVRCTGPHCGHAIAWQDSSQLAIQAWRMTIVLSR